MRPALSTSHDASIRFSARFPRAGHFLLLVQEKVTKENTPRMPRCLRQCARTGRGSLIELPCPSNELARIVRATFTGISDLPSPRQTGAQDQEQQSARLLRYCFCAQERAALAFPGPHCIAAAAGGNARRGVARDRADSVVWTGMCSQRNPAADADPARRMRDGRNALGRVSLLTFSARAEKVRRSPEGRVEAFAPETKQTRTGFPPAQE